MKCQRGSIYATVHGTQRHQTELQWKDGRPGGTQSRNSTDGRKNVRMRRRTKNDASDALNCSMGSLGVRSWSCLINAVVTNLAVILAVIGKRFRPITFQVSYNRLPVSMRLQWALYQMDMIKKQDTAFEKK